MENMHSARALRPVEAEPGVLVHTASDRRLAVEQWLLATQPSRDRDRARREWEEAGVAMLPLGTLLSAVRIPGHLVVAAAGLVEHDALDAFLDEALYGQPVICDPRGNRYYALVPGTMPVRWRKAAEEWRALGVDCLGRDTYLGVPTVRAVERDPLTLASYWSVPMPSAGELCAPPAVARLIAAGQCRLAERAEA